MTTLFGTIHCKLYSSTRTQHHAAFKVTEVHFLPHSEDGFELQQVVLTTSTVLKPLSRCVVIGCLTICVNTWLYQWVYQHLLLVT